MENIRRVEEVAKLMVEAGLIVIVSFISPFRSERRMARALLGPQEFIEIYVYTPIEICETRDPKALYKLARAGNSRTSPESAALMSRRSTLSSLLRPERNAQTRSPRRCSRDT